MKTFKELGLSEELLRAVKELNFVEPSPIQEKAIPLGLLGKDIVGGSATGSGKTLAFSVPIIEKIVSGKGVQALILSPTRELAEQITVAMRTFSKYKDFKFLAIYGGVDMDNQVRRIPRSDVIIGTPGRILDHLERRTLDLSKVRFLVLDEVDRMLDMGFLRDVEKIVNKCPKNRQNFLFSATISRDIEHLIGKYTNNPEEISVESYVDHSKLKQVYYDVPSNLKFSLLVHLLKKENADLVMVFSNTRRNADLIAGNLSKQGINVEIIHGGLTQGKRIRALEDFHCKGKGVLICTDVAARGLDIKGVTHVYNYDIPDLATDYVHRIGRTARAGKNGIAINLVSNRDYMNFNTVMQNKELNITKEELPFIDKVELDLRAVVKKAPRSFSCSRGDSSKRNGFSRGSGSPRRDSSSRGGNSSPRRSFSRGNFRSGSSGSSFRKDDSSSVKKFSSNNRFSSDSGGRFKKTFSKARKLNDEFSSQEERPRRKTFGRNFSKDKKSFSKRR